MKLKKQFYLLKIKFQGLKLGIIVLVSQFAGFICSNLDKNQKFQTGFSRHWENFLKIFKTGSNHDWKGFNMIYH